MLKQLNNPITKPLDKAKLTVFLLVCIYIVGFIGISRPLHEDFVLLTPFNLIISAAFLLWNHTIWERRFWIVVVACFMTGMIVEILGVQTGLVFGEYTYGQTLGWKIAGVPWVIGLNWLVLVYGTGVLMTRLIPKWHWAIKSIFAAGLMTAIDVIIEPVAIHYDFWSWGGGDIPLQNYAAWFVISLPLCMLFFKLLPNLKNPVGIALIVIQTVFFALLNLGLS